ncbi:MAG TPA: MFS transporter [Chloroflexota bacterium]|nr:MFS transporter [Chloroflexota bacterium]
MPNKTEVASKGSWLSRRWRGGTFASLATYNFRLFWMGQLVSQAGSWMQRMAQAWLVLDISHSATALGIVSALQFLPILCLTALAGVFVDRWPKYRLLVVTQAAALVQSVALAVLTGSGHIQLWEIYILAALLGLITALDNPARQAMVVELVGREQLTNAVGLNSAQFNASRLIGPAIGGLAIAAWGVTVCFYLNAVSFLAVLVGLLMMRPELFQQVPERYRRGQPVLRQMGEGLRFVFGTPRLALVIIPLASLACFGYNFQIVIPLLARDVLHIGAEGFGVLTAAGGIGALMSALIVATRGAASMRLLLLAAAMFGVCDLGFALSPWTTLSFLLLVVTGYAGQTVNASANTMLQLGSPDQLRGRVMGVFTMFFAGMSPLGSMFTGLLADGIGVQLTIAIEAGICMAAVVAVVAVKRVTLDREVGTAAVAIT